jgi:hypothetical protein
MPNADTLAHGVMPVQSLSVQDHVLSFILSQKGP